jgi:hypothetical protein
MDTYVSDYDAENDVLRVFTTNEAEIGGTAVPLRDFTLVVSDELDRVLEIVIDDATAFIKYFVLHDEAIPREAHGVDLLKIAQRDLENRILLIARNYGPIAKDLIARWDAGTH